jgi:hypothetical protein
VNKRWTAVIVVLVVLVGGWWWWRSRHAEPPAAIDLVAQFSTAEKRSSPLPPEQTFTTEDVTIDGDTKRGIGMQPTSRLTWKITVPPDAWLRAWLAVKPEAWGKEGDGVLFRVGISDGRTYEELLNQYIDPHRQQNDRRWFPVQLDLSAYGGTDAQLIFNVNSSLPKQGDDRRNDLAFWGRPEIYVRQ